MGLVTGACLAHVGHRVVCVDKDPERVRALESGRVPIYEPHLEELIRDSAERISFSAELEPAVRAADVLFIAVDTPTGENGSANLSSVSAVARSVGRALASPAARREEPLVVVNKSTVPVGTGDYVSMLIEEGIEETGEQRPEREFLVVSNPEFLREGSAVGDSLSPDRIVLGSDSEEALKKLRELYAPIIERGFAPVRGMENADDSGDDGSGEDGSGEDGSGEEVPWVRTDLASAEMIKYAANAFLATKISFINEISGLCELVGADVDNVALGIGLDERIGPRFLNAGIGWGGSCFPKDVAALRSIAREYDYEPRMLDATVAVNERQRREVIVKLQRELRTLKGKRVVLLGLSFKPETDDLRDAPSLHLARSLHDLGARAVGYDPVAAERARESLAASGVELKLASDPYDALSGAHAAVVVTEWEEIRSLKLAAAAAKMNEPRLLVDGRNVFDPAEARSHGLLYRGFGRG